METMALAILGWAAANLVIAAVWTTYCLWPRRHPDDASLPLPGRGLDAQPPINVERLG